MTAADDLYALIRKYGGRPPVYDGNDERVSVNASTMMDVLRVLDDALDRRNETRLNQFSNVELQCLDMCLAEVVDYTLGEGLRAPLMFCGTPSTKKLIGGS